MPTGINESESDNTGEELIPEIIKPNKLQQNSNLKCKKVFATKVRNNLI